MQQLATKHTFGLFASSENLFTFQSIDDFISCYDDSKPSWLLGGGSNTVFIDDFHGNIYINELKGIEYQKTDAGHQIKVAAGENWHDFVTYCLKNGWHGLENLALIPGSVGAAPIQNIGAYGVEVERYIQSVSGIYLATKQPFTFAKNQCEFGYRDSIFKSKLAEKILITEVVFLLPFNAPLITSYGELKALENPTAELIFQTVISVRKQKLPDPAEKGNAGSFFKNPVISVEHYEKLQSSYNDIPGYKINAHQIKVPAAWLIDQAGMKGQYIGDVQCHQNQPLVLINNGHATGDDVLTMAKKIRDTVFSKYQITLEIEVRLVGDRGLINI